MGQYFKKPIVIEARQWGPPVVAVALEIIKWINENNGQAKFLCGRHCCYYKHGIELETLEGPMLAGPGWWIIQGIKGEFYPCRNDIFKETYEEVTT